jgi:hypothetical protein
MELKVSIVADISNYINPLTQCLSMKMESIKDTLRRHRQGSNLVFLAGAVLNLRVCSKV